MSQTKQPTPAFMALAGSQIDGENVVLTVLRDDGRRFNLPFAGICVPLVIAALSAEVGKLDANSGPDTHPARQPIVVAAIQTAMRDNGAAALLLTLESGAVLPMEISRAGLTTLSAQIAELLDMTNKPAHH